MIDYNLTGKNVLVTGSSRGIGKAIAEGFLQQGAHLSLVARGQERLSAVQSELQEKFPGQKIMGFCADCTQPSEIDKIRQQLRQNNAKLDILVINVGDGRSSDEAVPEPEQWQKVWASNFESALHTTQVMLPLLTTPGCILFISSIAGLEALGAPVDYSTAKAAVNAFAKNIARKLAPTIRVNVLAPGNVLFDGGSWDEKIQQDPVRIEALIKSKVPMQRFARPDEIANAALFLCSDNASFITGSTLVVDGGQTVGGF